MSSWKKKRWPANIHRRTPKDQVDDALIGCTIASILGMIVLFLSMYLGKGCGL